MVTGPAAAAGLKPSNTKHADFDLWIRMATDNKINSSNSWNFALIDYFHDLSLLRDGDGINFQKASATLDGCVKIYSSRVDSAATETGKLLSGLATKTRGSANEIEVEDEEQEQDENQQQEKSKHRRRANRSETTLVKSFDVLKAKKVDMELSVDPLFKKALADFDEGGAKSLLLNILSVDDSGRVLFDTTSESTNKAFKSGDDDGNEVLDPIGNSIEEKIHEQEEETSKILEDDAQNEEVDIIDLQKQFFPNLSDLAELTICPSMKNLEQVIKNGANPSELLQEFGKGDEMEEPLHHDFDNIDYDLGDNFENDFSNNAASIFFDDDDDDDDRSTNNGQNTTLQRLFDDGLSDSAREKSMAENVSEVPDFDLLSYFDSTLKKNWANGPEHWKVQNLKRKSKIINNVNTVGDHNSNADGDPSQNKKSKEKSQFQINFLDDEDEIDEDKLFAEGKSSILLPKSQWISSNKHILPDDKQFSTKRLIHLFIKSSFITTTFNRKKPNFKEHSDELADENFWAENYKNQSVQDSNLNKSRVDILREDLNEIHQSYDQSFFQDDLPQDDFHNGYDDDNDSKVDEFELPPSQLGYGSQLVTGKNSFRPSLLNFSRVAKKVDVKLLKDNLWGCLQQELLNINAEADKENLDTNRKANEIDNENPENETRKTSDKRELKFSSIVNNLSSKYTIEERNDLSTSFCFICLLHLANENGFSIQSTVDNSDLFIMS